MDVHLRLAGEVPVTKLPVQQIVFHLQVGDKTQVAEIKPEEEEGSEGRDDRKRKTAGRNSAPGVIYVCMKARGCTRVQMEGLQDGGFHRCSSAFLHRATGSLPGP